MQPYSPERRTALVLCGTGAHGAYHAGVLRALQEAGVKIDVMAGQGVGAGAAALAAIDGGARLWEADGLWRSPGARAFYRWKWPLRVSLLLAALALIVLLAPILLEVIGISLPPTTWALAVLALVAVIAALTLMGGARADGATSRRRFDGSRVWRLLGAPIEAAPARNAFAEALGKLLRGDDGAGTAARAALGRRYGEVLAESLGQPGFRELMIVVTDLDAHRDIVGAVLREPYRRQFTAPRPDVERQSEALDLAGAGAEHTFDLVAAALTPPLACDPHQIPFGVDTFWRGETHRACDRPGACSRLLEELAAAGVSQAIVVSGVAAAGAPHRLRAVRTEPRQRLGEFLAAAESASLRDAMELARLRFDSVYVIAPSHNPVGAFDFDGAYDEASDRRQDLDEVMTRAYEDAYHQFIEPIVGGSGERLAQSDPRSAELPR